MADDQTGSSGGFHAGKVGRDFKVQAHGDIVGRDKITTVTTTRKGFTSEEQKHQFLEQIELLRSALREVKGKLESHQSLTQDQKDEAAKVVIQQVKALKEIKEKAATAPSGKQPPADLATTVDKTLDEAGRVVDKFQNLAQKASGIGNTIAEFASRYGPLIASTRQLFGL